MKISSKSPKSFLNRYTTLPVLLDILVRQRITLLSPNSWEDRNDAYYLEQYKLKRKLKTVVALCFSQCRETFHHWKIFAGGAGGVCIEFDREKLLAGVRRKKGFCCRPVVYQFIRDVKSNKPAISDWPFLKRKPYRDEREFRIVYEDANVSQQTKEIPIELSCIRQITLAPWIPASIATTVSEVIQDLPGCDQFFVTRSSLLETAAWKAAIDIK